MDRKQKETIALLQIGTFLEYFDLMLYIHMAVLLNELFYPKTDQNVAALIAAFSFCSVYVLRPIGALIFGYIGDVFGRKPAIIISTMSMGLACILLVGLPTYDQIGIAASVGITLCRGIQGMAAQGEIIGTQIYLIETILPPMRYFIVSLSSFFTALGGVAALGAYSLITYFGMNWRFVFLIGAFIALVGTAARTKIHETPDFVDMKRRCKIELEEAQEQSIEKEALLQGKQILSREKINIKTAWAYFFISCGYPVCFYYSFIHLAQHLKNDFNYSADAVLHNNLIVSICYTTSWLIYSCLTLKIHPLKILKLRVILFAGILLYLFLQNGILSSPIQILCLQCSIMCFGILDVPAAGIFANHFPTARKFSSISLIYAFSRIIIYVTTSFGVMLFTKYFGNYGMFYIMIPVMIGFTWGITHFTKIEQERNERQLGLTNKGNNLFYFPFVLKR